MSLAEFVGTEPVFQEKQKLYPSVDKLEKTTNKWELPTILGPMQSDRKNFGDSLRYIPAIMEFEKRGYKVEERLGAGNFKRAYRVVDLSSPEKELCVRFSNALAKGNTHIKEIKTFLKIKEKFPEEASRVVLETVECFEFPLHLFMYDKSQEINWVAEIQPAVTTEKHDPKGFIAEKVAATGKTKDEVWAHLKDDLWKAVEDLGLSIHSDDNHPNCDQMGIPDGKDYGVYLDIDSTWLKCKCLLE